MVVISQEKKRHGESIWPVTKNDEFGWETLKKLIIINVKRAMPRVWNGKKIQEK